MNLLSRRHFIALIGSGLLSPIVSWPPGKDDKLFRIRTITAGVELGSTADLRKLGTARQFLAEASRRFGDAYEIQTTRMSTQPIQRYASSWMSRSTIEEIAELDSFAADAGAVMSIGPTLTEDVEAAGFASWASDLVQATSVVSFSSFIASAEHGLHPNAIRAAAEAIVAIANGTPGGEGNFRYCATAFCPPGTPFFPAAYHDGSPAFSIGLESPNLLLSAIDGAKSLDDATRRMRSALDEALEPLEKMAEDLARESGWRYLGIDTSPAPGLDASIGDVIEALSGQPFGSPSTLSACSAITGVLQGLNAVTCGYSGLMLPVLEDRVLAARADEGRYGVSELLLYSSVCGTGLDVVPLAGDVSVDGLADTIRDVAALAVRYQKPLSARLFPVPGKKVGETVDFDNPFLTACRVMPLG